MAIYIYIYLSVTHSDKRGSKSLGRSRGTYNREGKITLESFHVMGSVRLIQIIIIVISLSKADFDLFNLIFYFNVCSHQGDIRQTNKKTNKKVIYIFF